MSVSQRMSNTPTLSHRAADCLGGYSAFICTHKCIHTCEQQCSRKQPTNDTSWSHKWTYVHTTYTHTSVHIFGSQFEFTTAAEHTHTYVCTYICAYIGTCHTQVTPASDTVQGRIAHDAWQPYTHTYVRTSVQYTKWVHFPGVGSAQAQLTLTAGCTVKRCTVQCVNTMYGRPWAKGAVDTCSLCWMCDHI